jgi:hypothetical protein
MTATGPEQFQSQEAPKGAGTKVPDIPQNTQDFNDTYMKSRGLDNGSASKHLGDVGINEGATKPAAEGPSDQAIKTQAGNFATQIRDGGPQDAQKMLDNLARGTAGGDAPVIAKEANNALLKAGLSDRYSVSGSSDGSLKLTRTEAVPNSLRQEAKVDFYKPGEAHNDLSTTPDPEKMGDVARRFAEQVRRSDNPELMLRNSLEEMKKLGADPTDVARPLNQALKRSGVDMSVSGSSTGEVVLNSYKTKTEAIAETKVPAASRSEVDHKGTTSGDTRTQGDRSLAAAGQPADENAGAAHRDTSHRQGDSTTAGRESQFVPSRVNTGNIRDQVMDTLRRIGSGPGRAQFLSDNGILPPSARSHAAQGDRRTQATQQREVADNGILPPSSTEVSSTQGTEQQRAEGDQQREQTRRSEVRLGDRTVQKDGATIGLSKVNGKDVTTAVVRPDGSSTVYGDHDADGNPRSIQEYKRGAHEPFRTATRGENEIWTTRQGGKEFQKQGHLTVENGTHKFQTTDGTTFVRTPDGKVNFEVSPKADRVQEREGSKIEYRTVNGKEITSAVTYPNGFKAVYGGHDANGNPTSIKEYAKGSGQPFRTAQLNGDTWKIESQGNQPIELKGH